MAKMTNDEHNRAQDNVAEVLADGEVKRFAQSFENEAVLQQRLETLFSRMKNLFGVKILQGTQEHGKDIIFYERGSLGERRLIACVVKNDKISGQISSQSGASRVLFQANQALTNPYVNAKGESEFVSQVYAISPYPVAPEAMNSIKGALGGAKGQLHFLCGRDLLDLFREHWPAYVFFDSNLLTLYLASLEVLDENSAFAAVMMRGGFVLDDIRTLSGVYVRQGFVQAVPDFLFAESFPRWADLDCSLRRTEVEDLVTLLDDAKSSVLCSRFWCSDSLRAQSDSIIQLITHIETSLVRNWEQRYQVAVQEADEKSQMPPGKNNFVVKSPLSVEFEERVKEVSAYLYAAGEELRQIKQSIEALPRVGSEVTLNTSEFKRLTELKLAASEFPWALDATSAKHEITFSPDILDHLRVPLLVTGSAGYGKTSFCRMATIVQSARFAQGQSKILPCYVPLYRLNNRVIKGDEDACELFIESAELLRYLKQKSSPANSEQIAVRLFLDGLDEVTDESRRHNLIKVAKSASDAGSVQVVVTAREHVTGQYLSWLSRLSIAPFTDSQIQELAQKWLDKQELQKFADELKGNPDIRELIRVPLLANLTLALFKQIGALPETRNRLYETFVQLLCGGWDAAKNIRRDSQFGSQPKLTTITHLAWMLHTNQMRDFAHKDFLNAVRHPLGAMAESYKMLLDECVQDGIIVRVGERYAFAHLSFQEYLAAKSLNEPSGSRIRQALVRFLEGDDWWSEVMRFYVAAVEDPVATASYIADAAEKLNGRSHTQHGVISSQAVLLINYVAQSHKGFVPYQSIQKKLASKRKVQKR